jgi:hypothetical protein
VDDALLFLHVLSAFMLGATVVMLSAVALGAAVGSRTASVGNLLWDVGGAGTLVFGVWMALRSDFYEITDGWVLAALALWVVAAATAGLARKELTDDVRYTSRGLLVHWGRAALVIAFLVLMIWKPGA